jgi:SAM-dependent methyltransferase
VVAPDVGARAGSRYAVSHGGIDAETAPACAQHFDAAFGRRLAEKALDGLVVVRGARVLDVACGTGAFARLAAHVTGTNGQVVGVDPAKAAIDTARRVDPTSAVEWRRDDLEDLPFADASFDVVACQHALHRFPDRARIAAEMRRVLLPGGLVGVMTWGPIEENPAFAVELDAVVKAGLDGSGVVESLLDAFALHRPEDLVGMAEQAGLVDASVRTVRLLAALPPAADWARVYPAVPPLNGAWHQCDQQARDRFLARATELLRPFEHDEVLRVQVSCRLLVARAPLA